VSDPTIFAQVQLRFEGLHCWPEAGDFIPEVAFLSNLHRHIFHVTVKVEQYHDDRDIEYIAFKRKLEAHVREEIAPGGNLGRQSCEQIGTKIGRHVQSLVGSRSISVTVLEDGENGAVLYFPKEAL